MAAELVCDEDGRAHELQSVAFMLLQAPTLGLRNAKDGN